MYKIFKITSDSTIDFAAEELKKYLRMMMPRCGEIPIKYAPEASDGFRIGLMSDFGLDTSDAEDITLDDIIYIDADKSGGIIAGSNPVATLIAIYRYLRFCGCRWIFPGVDGECIPIIDEPAKVNYRKLADHRYRGQCNEGAEFQQSMIETIDFTPKIGLNTYMLEFDNPICYYNPYYDHKYSTVREAEPISRDTVLQWKRQCEAEIQKRGLHFHDMGHGWTAEPFGIDSSNGWFVDEEDFVPPESRKYVAMLNGERKLLVGKALLSNACMSQKEARSIMVNYIADYAEKQNNVDFLHVWLADGENNICECVECQKKTPSDWYVILLNELDIELTKRGLDTHIVFIVYTNTFWAPLEEVIKHQKRFTMLYAPLGRVYTETYAKDADMSKLIPYTLNQIKRPSGMSDALAYLYDWKKNWSGDCFCYEYHFFWFQYWNINNMFLSKILYEDICSLKKHGLSGIIEDGSQRSFFPTGFQFYVYGETLFDSSVSFEELKEDYFSHAFGENWKEVATYLETLSEYMDTAYYLGLKSVDAEKGRFYCPEMADNMPKVRELVESFKPVIEANKKQPCRASTVAWQLLTYHAIAVCGIADITEYKCVGKHKEARDAIEKLIDEMSKYEVYIERYYDHYLFAHSFHHMKIDMKDA